MDIRDLQQMERWFEEYVQSFRSGSDEDQRNISLKELHTARVKENAAEIVRSLDPSESLVLLCETAALFHDIGRFPQYARYRTFKDSDSLNHGRFGAEVLEEKRILKNLPRDEQDLILTVVRFHNAFALPHIADPRALEILRIVRDADKLDIWRVFTEYFKGAAEDRASAAGLGLPDLPGYSQKVLDCLSGERLASLSDVTRINDFKILQLSWVYDLNFPASFRLLERQGYLRRLASSLPPLEEIGEALAILYDFISLRLAADPASL